MSAFDEAAADGQAGLERGSVVEGVGPVAQVAMRGSHGGVFLGHFGGLAVFSEGGDDLPGGSAFEPFLLGASPRVRRCRAASGRGGGEVFADVVEVGQRPGVGSEDFVSFAVSRRKYATTQGDSFTSGRPMCRAGCAAPQAGRLCSPMLPALPHCSALRQNISMRGRAFATHGCSIACISGCLTQSRFGRQEGRKGSFAAHFSRLPAFQRVCSSQRVRQPDKHAALNRVPMFHLLAP